MFSKENCIDIDSVVMITPCITSLITKTDSLTYYVSNRSTTVYEFPHVLKSCKLIIYINILSIKDF